MDVLQIQSETATIRITRQELVVLANALNETREALEDWEYSTRVGASPAEAEALRIALQGLLVATKE